ncbi:3-hydroxyacyl-CoA dehydrogenase NAD-binding domain-containing protein [Sphingobacterium psychroaquaticum]|uniref:3-hydroxyacyl-CoA dehydrogenase / enoyl-CoA hydratase / 3-hydroxybutyryl-CoA epimerase n=1 Tax=Sphingobacterium psychroaquaticum TaxID=561061 RepID=A0A1X7KPY3_9SPHI|nr:3-hydroxyacyl-CoA dehydrogenase NAD-binding domain-containing protein [Sphingobacterium psychroaquaticum]SMG42778.1 3-hydroxyacyl-CoA dehydrogenase / enoyl-CoA hydratase / 3-hydroxybutyryl-CoA epimerase [Sphingobacterium psychroaquaticum]
MTTENIFFKTEILPQGIAWIKVDMAGYPTNLFTLEFQKTYLQTVNALLNRADIKGLILTSARKDFMAGADVGELLRIQNTPNLILEHLQTLHRGILANEAIQKPMVSIISGHALGGGFELALTTHHRIATAGRYKIGLPEASLGLFPGAGGTIKLSKMLGIEKAAPILLKGTTFSPKDALTAGLIHDLVEYPEIAFEDAVAWILTHPNVIQPWNMSSENKGLRSPAEHMTMTASIGNLRKATHGNYPGLNYCLAAIHDGVDLPIERALDIEARYFIKTLLSKEAKSMIRTNFFGINQAKKGKNRTNGTLTTPIQKLGILGAGMMGAGIAYVAAKAGIDVILKDISITQAEKGKVYAEQTTHRALTLGRTTRDKADQLLDHIKPTDSYAYLADCDLIIEAVFEDPKLKKLVTHEAEVFLHEKGFFASNTSSLPITKLAKASIHPERFIGIHFFSPVDRMPLIEIIKGEKTNQETLARAVDFANQLGKVPIVVNDSPGFFTSRIFGKYNLEAVNMLLEGVSPIVLENVAKRAGLAVGPLAVMDEISLDLMADVLQQNEQRTPVEEQMLELIEWMVRAGRKGKKAGKGFYDYPEGQRKTIWQHPYSSEISMEISTADIQKRLMHIQALDSYRCLEEGVLESTMDGDIGSVLGLGFAPQTGGVFSYIDQIGLPAFIADCRRFRQYGEQWEVPKSLLKLAQRGFTFYTGLRENDRDNNKTE